VFLLLGRASIHYKFLISIICSYSFKVYFEIIAGPHVLPVRGQKETYRGWFDEQMEKNLGPIAEDVDAEVEVDGQLGEVVDAEVEVDGQLEEVVDAEVDIDGQLEDDPEVPFELEGVS
jgi:hypothetical protein